MCCVCGSRKTLSRVLPGRGNERISRPAARAAFLGPLSPVRPHTILIDEEVTEAEAIDQAEPVEADEEEEVEEALVAKLFRSPTAPTAAERAAHAPTHLPYRSWCDECVAGRRDNPAHRPT